MCIISQTGSSISDALTFLWTESNYSSLWISFDLNPWVTSAWRGTDLVAAVFFRKRELFKHVVNVGSPESGSTPSRSKVAWLRRTFLEFIEYSFKYSEPSEWPLNFREYIQLPYSRYTLISSNLGDEFSPSI